MRKTGKLLIVVYSVSSLLLGGCTNAGAGNKESEQQTSGSSEMLVQLEQEEGQFKIKNVGQTAIDSLTLTTYPPPLTTNILLLQYSFSKDIGTLEKGSTIVVKKYELKNDKGASLSNSKRKVGAIRIGGRVKGQPKGLIFTPNDGKWVLSLPNVRWSVVTQGELLGPVDDPKRGKTP